MNDLSAAPDVSIIIVSWQVRDLLKRALASISESADQTRRIGHTLNPETIVVDNNSNDGTSEMVRTSFPFVNLIVNNANRGFAAANNQALALARGRYILFLNPDAELLSDALWKMYEFMEEQPLVGLIGPRLENPDGSLQRSCRRFPTFWSATAILLKLHNFFPMSLPVRKYYMWAFEHKTIRRVDQVMGACMMTRRKALEEIGNFDESFYIFFEEVDLCKRINDAGYLTLFYPDAVVRHHRSSAFVKKRALWRQWHFAKSCRRYFWKHHNFAAAGLITVISFFSLGPAMLVELFNLTGIKFGKNQDL